MSQTTPAPIQTAYAPIRDSGHGPWINISELRSFYNEAIATGEAMDMLSPAWAKLHRVLRVARVEIREVPA